MKITQFGPGGIPSAVANAISTGIRVSVSGTPSAGDVVIADSATEAHWGPAPGSSSAAAWMPLTTVVGGEPELVWDGDDSLIPTFVPI